MAFLFLRECVVVWLLVALGTTAAAGQVVSGVSESLVMNCRSDFILAGGAQEVSDPLHAVRSGSPGQQSSATPIRTIQPGAMITGLSFAYRYNSGYGPTGLGANFTVSVASRTVYQSPPLTHYRYSDNRSLYSPPVQITIGSLAIAVPANASDAHISFVFNNNARNVQLLLPLVHQGLVLLHHCGNRHRRMSSFEVARSRSQMELLVPAFEFQPSCAPRIRSW